MATVPIPTWQVDTLNQLSSQGQLSGVNPNALAVMDLAESSGKGGGINSSGYGGFFGLGAGSTYPGGTVSSSLLSDPGQSSFAQQAKIAASEFASLLKGQGGNYIAAEQQYQTGSPSGIGEGASLFQSYGIGGTPSSLSSSSSPSSAPADQAVTTSLNLNPFDGFGLPGELYGGLKAAGGAVSSAGGGAIASGLLGALSAITSPLKAFVEDTGLVVLGIILIAVGLVVVALKSGASLPSSSSSSSPGPSSSSEEAKPAEGGGELEEGAEVAAA